MVTQRRPSPPHTRQASSCLPPGPTTSSQPTSYVATYNYMCNQFLSIIALHDDFNTDMQAVVVLAHKIWEGARSHGERGSASLQRGLGAEPPAGSRGRAPGQESGGRSLPEAEAFLAFGRSMEAANLPTFRNFGNTKTSDIYVIFAKKSWVATKRGGRPGLKPPLYAAM